MKRFLRFGDERAERPHRAVVRRAEERLAPDDQR
jgi:hypothetical protein